MLFTIVENHTPNLRAKALGLSLGTKPWNRAMDPSLGPKLWVKPLGRSPEQTHNAWAILKFWAKALDQVLSWGSALRQSLGPTPWINALGFMTILLYDYVAGLWDWYILWYLLTGCWMILFYLLFIHFSTLYYYIIPLYHPMTWSCPRLLPTLLAIAFCQRFF